MSTKIHRNRQTKIVATLGPTSSSYEQIRALFWAGADVFRLNFSHGTADDHRARMALIRQVEKEFDHPIAVLGDLQGPKLRLGVFEKSEIAIKEGQSIRLDLDPTPGNDERVCLPHPEIFQAIAPGSELLVDDGKVKLRVMRAGPDYAEVQVVNGSKLSDRKGVNVPTVVLPISALTEKDRADLEVALEIGCDWIALSFVQRPEDVVEARRLIGDKAALLVKLEKPSAIESLDPIIELADGAMVARGDLGVEMPAEDVPHIQKQILHKARKEGKPVIVATQMLESMITNATPTRAEVSDVATAVYDGADAIMLSAETANGAYPVEAVTMMDRIASRTQEDPFFRTNLDAQHPDLEETVADAITAAAYQVAHTVKAAAIITYTTSGHTTLRAARERPGVKIVCLTSLLQTARRMALSFGTHPVYTKDVSSFDEMVLHAADIVRDRELVHVGQTVVITAGVPFGKAGNTNILRIAWIKESHDAAALSSPF